MNEVSGFAARHIGISGKDLAEVLATVKVSSLEELAQAVVPSALLPKQAISCAPFSDPVSEHQALNEVLGYAQQNTVRRSVIGQGYHGTVTPSPIRRSIFENPAWYTAYTPYQPEIAQGRLEALLNFQTMVADLTGLPVANASLLDEGTAVGEGLAVAVAVWRQHHGDTGNAPRVWVATDSFAQTKAVVRTRARGLGVQVVESESFPPVGDNGPFCAGFFQFPASSGALGSPQELVAKIHAAGALCILAADPLSLLLMQAPGSYGVDICVGSTQRFGIPLGFGGPHAAFFAVKDEYKRLMPGRLVGVSKDRLGNRALRLSLQTREQHIRRERATSNICTSQVLLAVMASMYAVYHGAAGLRRIASRVHAQAVTLAAACTKVGFAPTHAAFFDTLHFSREAHGAERIKQVMVHAAALGFQLFLSPQGDLQLSVDETITDDELQQLAACFEATIPTKVSSASAIPAQLMRSADEPLLAAPVFSNYHTESEFIRYVRSLEEKDFSLVHGMIPLGSCTMKLNSASSMLPVTAAGFSTIHPLTPLVELPGYAKIFADLEAGLCSITGLAACSLQPNAGSQGEYAGLMAIRRHLEATGNAHRKVCLIPKSAHGTNPASAVMCGFSVVVVECDEQGNISSADLEQKIAAHADQLAALMITYPSTHGVFEEQVQQLCAMVHKAGGQVYLDGANLNAHVGVIRAADVGADVCHINLHKTFSIPHGGGGPGMGPICVAAHLAPFLPRHPWIVGAGGTETGVYDTISAAPWGSASILVIPWMYMRMLGAQGMRQSTLVAIAAANYVARRLAGAYPILYTDARGYVAHECIIDVRSFKQYGIEAEDIAKRLMDYGFHAPTLSWPVAGTLMIEPTESESKAELDRFCDALLAIRQELAAIEQGAVDAKDNLLKNAPHTCAEVCSSTWTHSYRREEAAFPVRSVRERKLWPAVARIDGVYGDKNLVCTCEPMESYQSHA